MITLKKNIDNLFENWLSINFVLIFFMILVGGLTRLTNSGLSITEWELFSGVLPPLSNSSWLIYFDLYKQIPQFKILYPSMTLEEFKIIFYWEYAHRIFGRLIGLFFLLPLIYFYYSKKIDQKYLIPCYLIFFLILCQGFVGWYMVKSGLVNDVTVSHYRLSLHLTIAMIIISLIFWLILNFKNKKNKSFFNFSKKTFPYLFLILLIFAQIVFGAFVSGLDAGKIYQTWPLMNYSYFPDDFIIKNYLDLTNFENHSLVQFYHRNLAYLISLYILILGYFIFKREEKKFYKTTIILFIIIFLQIFLGIFTLLSGLNISIASAHQITSIILVLTAIRLYYITIN